MFETNRFFCLTALSLLLLVVPADATPHLDYVITCESLQKSELELVLTVTGWEPDTLSLQGVPVYLDNPLAEGNGAIVSRLEVSDGRGEEPPGLRRVESGSAGGLVLQITPVPDTLVVRFKARVAYRHSRQTRDYPIHLPFMDKDQAWLYGNYLFCHPRLDAAEPASVRTPVDIRLSFDLPDSVPLVGLPAAELAFENLHELLSIQFGLGRFLVEETEADGVPVSLIFKNGDEFDEAEREILSERTVATVAGVKAFFGSTPYPTCSFLYFRDSGTGGLEGAYACQAYVPAGVDLSSLSDRNSRVFAVTVLHEFFHTWNPITLFALEDPWFKEGVTSYYGNVLSMRLGFYTIEDYRSDWERDAVRLEDGSLVGDIPLTDPRIWSKEYDGEDWRHLSYTRGHAVAMLLDVAIREVSGNTHSLDDVMRLLARRHLHGGYTHEQLMEAIHAATSYDAIPFFDDYVDGNRVPTVEDVLSCFMKAEVLGIFEGPER